MPRYRLLCLIPALACSALAATLARAVPMTIEPDAALDAWMADRQVVFLARDLARDRGRALNPGQLDERHAPFSTFKIPNFLIALETGAVGDPEALRDWDPATRPAEPFWPDSWRQAQSLVTAFRRSAVWFFRDIAVEVGGQHYRQRLAEFGYGNATAADGNDGFWLDGTLRIAPREQVDFLARLLAGRFDIARQHLDMLREASLLDERDACRLHGKTGAGPVGDDFGGPFEGWLVGWVQCDGGAPTVFALWTRGVDFAAIRTFRQEAAVALLQHIGAYPSQEP